MFVGHCEQVCSYLLLNVAHPGLCIYDALMVLEPTTSRSLAEIATITPPIPINDQFLPLVIDDPLIETKAFLDTVFFARYILAMRSQLLRWRLKTWVYLWPTVRNGVQAKDPTIALRVPSIQRKANPTL